jgi:hypothetical protein
MGIELHRCPSFSATAKATFPNNNKAVCGNSTAAVVAKYKATVDYAVSIS